MPKHDLRELFIEQLKDIYDAEQRITKALPKLVKAASSEELSSALESHLEETGGHVTRLESIFKDLNIPIARKTCQGIIGLLDEGQSVIDEFNPGSAMDCAIIAAAQKVEHYEMAAYGCLRDWAKALDYDDATDALQETLDEEGGADKKLTEIAETLNSSAAEAANEPEGEPVTVGRHGGANRSHTKSRTR